MSEARKRLRALTAIEPVAARTSRPRIGLVLSETHARAAALEDDT